MTPSSLAPASAADDRQAMISLELHHRVQNTLAIVLALARLTARSVDTIAEFQVAFGDRIQAMARTNSLLLRGHAQAIDVLSALQVELEPYSGPVGQVTLQCDPVTITADAALSLSLMIHELATNAMKYGALSTPAGRLTVRCKSTVGGGVMNWREVLPGVTAGGKAGGSGLVLIQRLARDLGGSARMSFGPGGLSATITFRCDPRL